MTIPRARTWPSKQRARAAAGSTLLVLVAAAPAALAEGPPPARDSPVALTWDATPACSDAAHVLDEILHILGEGSGPRKTVAARVGVEKEEGVRGEVERWRVTLIVTTDGVSRTRTFEAESCGAAADAVALILAIDVDPQVATRPPPLANLNPPPLDVATPDANPAPIPSAATPSPVLVRLPPVATPPHPDPPRSTSRFPLHGIAAASLALDSGSLPSVGVGANLALGVEIRSLRLELDGTYWGGQSASALKGPGGASFQLWSGSIRAAYLFGFGSFSLGPLVDGGFERMGAQGEGGTERDTSGTEVWGVLGAGGLALLRPVPHFAVRLLAEGELPWSRPTFVVQNPKPEPAEPVYRPSPVLARATLGAEVVFP